MSCWVRLDYIMPCRVGGGERAFLVQGAPQDVIEVAREG